MYLEEGKFLEGDDESLGEGTVHTDGVIKAKDFGSFAVEDSNNDKSELSVSICRFRKIGPWDRAGHHGPETNVGREWENIRTWRRPWS